MSSLFQTNRTNDLTKTRPSPCYTHEITYELSQNFRRGDARLVRNGQVAYSLFSGCLIIKRPFEGRRQPIA